MLLETKILLAKMLNKMIQSQTRRRVAALHRRAYRCEANAVLLKAEAQFLERSIQRKDEKSE